MRGDVMAEACQTRTFLHVQHPSVGDQRAGGLNLVLTWWKLGDSQPSTTLHE